MHVRWPITGIETNSFLMSPDNHHHLCQCLSRWNIDGISEVCSCLWNVCTCLYEDVEVTWGYPVSCELTLISGFSNILRHCLLQHEDPGLRYSAGLRTLTRMSQVVQSGAHTLLSAPPSKLKRMSSVIYLLLMIRFENIIWFLFFIARMYRKRDVN